MIFLLSTPEYNNVLLNTIKVRVHLRNGVAEIFDQHQNLMGKVENDLVEIETNFENRIEKILYVLQDAVFIVVSAKNPDTNLNQKLTTVYIYAKRVREIGSPLAMINLTKECEETKISLENETNKLTVKEGDKKGMSSKSLLLTEELKFLKKALDIAKTIKG